jgi:hypothetical protein
MPGAGQPYLIMVQVALAPVKKNETFESLPHTFDFQNFRLLKCRHRRIAQALYKASKGD